MAAGIALQQNAILTSWKEIATYLGKGVRTVQRWELEFRLPVRRPNEKLKGFVYASRDELDRWLATHWLQRAREPEISEPSNGAKAGKSATQVYLELRSEYHQLTGELSRNLQTLAECRETLSQQIARLRTLLLQPVVPVSDDQRTPPQQLLPKHLPQLQRPIRLLDYLNGGTEIATIPKGKRQCAVKAISAAIRPQVTHSGFQGASR
jgi:hypothetical protein